MFNDICTYNRKEKAYILTLPSGAQHAFSSGPKGKMQAFHFWLSVEFPAVFHMATHLAEANPHAERTIWKAAEIVVTGDMITRIDDGELVAMVQSSNDPYGRYLVTNEMLGTPEDEYLSCNCPAYREMQPVYIIAGEFDEMFQICKHSLAVWMLNRIDPSQTRLAATAQAAGIVDPVPAD